MFVMLHCCRPLEEEEEDEGLSLACLGKRLFTSAKQPRLTQNMPE